MSMLRALALLTILSLLAAFPAAGPATGVPDDGPPEVAAPADPDLIVEVRVAADGRVTAPRSRVVTGPTRRTTDEDSAPAGAEAPDAETRTLVVRSLDRSGAVVDRDVIRVSRWLRAEHAADGHLQASKKGRIEGRWFRKRDAAFAVTVPADAVTLQVHEPARRTTIAPQAGTVRIPAPQAQAAGTGPTRVRIPGFSTERPGNRIDLVIMGDGFTASQQDAFVTSAAQLAESLMGESPFRQYRPFFNVVGVFAPSAQSGSDFPPYQNGCTETTCCPEQYGTSSSGFRDTRYDSTFCSNGLARLVVVNDQSLVRADATAAYPNWDVLAVVVNSSEYGGSGGSIGVVSRSSSAREVFEHEMGHTLLRLDDEYTSPADYPPCSDRRRAGITDRCAPNVTDVTARSKIKWRRWIRASTPVPTPGAPGAGTVGLFEGAHYSPDTYYRSCYACKMQFLGTPWGPVSSEQLPLQMYGGAIRGGPSLAPIRVRAIDGRSPGSRTLTVRRGESRTFRVEILTPLAGKGAKVVWKVNGKVRKTTAARNGTTATFRWRKTGPGRATISVKVIDRGGVAHPSRRSQVTDRTSWVVR